MIRVTMAYLFLVGHGVTDKSNPNTNFGAPEAYKLKTSILKRLAQTPSPSGQTHVQELLSQRQFHEKSTNASLILITGLGGSCSRVVPGHLRSRGLYVETKNTAFDSHVPYKFNDLHKGFKPGKLQQYLVNGDVKLDEQLLAKSNAYFDNCVEKHKVCVFKEELLTFALPYFRKREDVCIIHTVREPSSWVFSNNFIGVHRWYTQVMGSPLSSRAQADLRKWLEWWNHERKTTKLTPNLHRYLYFGKAHLWKSVYESLAVYMKNVDKNQLLWRCKIDSIEKVEQFLKDKCKVQLNFDLSPIPFSRVLPRVPGQ
eukprot:UC4_evm5s1127